MKIALLCPSRGRPEKFRGMLESARKTAKGDFEVLLYLDDDDQTRSEYPDVYTVVGPRINLGPAYEVLRKEIKADLYMMGADDIVFRSPNWDVKVGEVVPKDLVCVVSFDDGSGPPDRPLEHGHPFVGSGLIEKLGCLAHPSLGHSCIDNWIVRAAKRLDRFYFVGAKIEHMHPKYKKGEWDQTYLDNDKEAKKRDGRIYAGL